MPKFLGGEMFQRGGWREFPPTPSSPPNPPTNKTPPPIDWAEFHVSAYLISQIRPQCISDSHLCQRRNLARKRGSSGIPELREGQATFNVGSLRGTGTCGASPL